MNDPIFFRSEDGLGIEATVFGGGDHWIVLAHGKSFDMESWYGFSGFLNENGFTAFPFNFRGYGRSDHKDGRYWLDVIGAVEYAKQKAAKVSVLGASMGAIAVLHALERYEGSVDGLVLLSPVGLPDDFSNLRGKAEKAFVFCTEGDFAFDTSIAVADKLPIPTQNRVFKGNSHAQGMLKDPSISDDLRWKIVDFLKSV